MYGVSRDDVSTQAKFHEAQELNFRLLSDPDGGVARKFGALPEGRPFAERVTFVIDQKGVLRHIDRSVDVRTHGADLARLIRGL